MKISEILLEYDRSVTERNYSDKIYSRALKDQFLPIEIKSHLKDKAQTVQSILQYIENKDPTVHNSYVEWLTRLYINDKIRLEDINTDLLRVYDAAKKQKRVPREYSDIGKIKSAADFVKILEQLDLEKILLQIGDNSLYLRMNNYFRFKEIHLSDDQVDKGNYKILLDNSVVRIIAPLDERAAIYFGQDARWCTARDDEDNAFSEYNKDGQLYILIPKQPDHMGEKYQLRFESDQFMDENDDEVELSFILNRFGDNILDVIPNGLFYVLIDACKNGHIALVKKMLSIGADVNAKDNDGTTPLHLASYEGHTEIVKLLLAHGADVNVKDEDVCTPLHWASSKGYTEVVKLLLEHGADVNIKNNDGDTPLYCASRYGYTEIVKLLLDRGADVNVKDNDGDTALRWASCEGLAEVVKLLLDYGADVNTKDNNGGTPLYWASSRGYTEVVKLLKQHGATE